MHSPWSCWKRRTYQQPSVRTPCLLPTRHPPPAHRHSQRESKRRQMRNTENTEGSLYHYTFSYIVDHPCIRSWYTGTCFYLHQFQTHVSGNRFLILILANYIVWSHSENADSYFYWTHRFVTELTIASIKANQLMLFREIFTLYFANHVKLIQYS